MNIKETIVKINEGYYNEDFMLLYNDCIKPSKRYTDACKSFLELYGERDIRMFSAPGRTEVGGNHTDHQHGCVLAGSVNLDVIAIVSTNNDNVVRIKSEGYDMDIISLDELDCKENECGKASALIRGMLGIMKSQGYNIGGFDAYTTSNVLKGSGLSSSAAFEVLIGVIINNLFNNGKVDAVNIAKFAQKAENIYFGKPCGLMDQMASSVGGFTSIDFNDTENLIINKIDFDLSKQNHSLCIVNTGGNHADLTDDYADITIGDKKIANHFGKDYLREVDEEKFFLSIAELREKYGDRPVLCAIHFFADNKRAIDEANALRQGRFDDFLTLVKQSGDSSFKYLQNVYSARFPNQQGLSVAIALTERFLNGRGAVRVHGGGFAGTIQAFIPNDLLEEYKEMIEETFGKNSCYILNIRSVGGHSLKI